MQTQQKSKALQTFLWALLIGAVIFLPFVIFDRGYFIYYGDFNVQQIPFYQLAHRAVRSGNILWSFYTDLGANFIGSYSFYLLFSPFFWLTLPFANSFLPFLMAPLLILKTACSALTAHLYLRRFVRDHNYAMIGALLYAFSGWMSFNIFFNHFHDVAVFFPLLLLALEKLVQEDKKGLFLFAVLVNAVVNYWFFVGEAIFVILYIILRSTDKSWGLSLKKFILIACEAVIGFGLSAVVLIPSVLAITGNPRTGTDELVMGWNIWLYWHEQRQPAIIQSLFFPPELPSRPNFLTGHGAKWASLSGWLPLFSMTGVLAYFFSRRNDWLKKMLAVCLVFALVPGLNSLFVLLNGSYYARWFYMPILLMALATIRALEDSQLNTAYFTRAIKWSGIVVALFAIMCGLTPNIGEDGKLLFGLAANPGILWVYVAITAICLIITAILLLHLRQSPRFLRLTCIAVAVVSVGFTVFYMANGKNDRQRSQWIIDHAINGAEKITLPDDGSFVRSDVYDGMDNIAMYWQLPNIQAFHSIVPPSIMAFYPAVGVTRDVGSRPEAEFYALRPLLSVKWLFIEKDKEEQQPMPGYEYFDTQNDFNIYENTNFLPMGFAYDRYITPEQLAETPKNHRGNLLLRAVSLEQEVIDRNSDILSPLEDEGFSALNEKNMAADVQKRRQYTAQRFVPDHFGFTVTTNFDSPQLLFLSVPWDKGFSATMITSAGDTPAPIRIEKANIGFMAVRVPAGPALVRFSYRTPGLVAGAVVSGGFLLIMAGYFFIRKNKPGTAKEDLGLHRALLEGQTISLSWEEYLSLYSDKKARAEHLQKVLNEAARKRVAEQLLQEDRTLHFNKDFNFDTNIDENGDNID